MFLQKRPAPAGGTFSLDRWERKVIGEKDGRSMFVQSADIDADGRTDVVTGAWWFRNPGGGQPNWERRNVGGAFRNLAAVYDFDNDGDLDLLGTKGAGSTRNSQFVWARNDGAGQFQAFENVSQGAGGFLQGVGVARFNIGDPLKIALSWHTPPGEFIQMLTVPADPSKHLWPIENIYNYHKPAKQLDIGDIDRDGNIDIFFVGNAGGGDLEWLRNEGGRQWKPFVYFSGAGNKSHRTVLADIDRNGRIDAVVGHYREDPGYLAWYEQPALATSKWTEHVIATPAGVYGPMSLEVADMDRDGDLDVIVGEHRLENMEAARLFIFENVDGAGRQWRKHLVHQGDEHHQGAHVVDIDRDGDLDIVSIGWTHNKVLLYENKSVDLRPVINVWYGDEQKFGRLGNPQ
ncbi:MAG: VCBS repeat-containing protein, partial [Acidobacteria bacterium]|nr:VCBS repeat-containing protein [Acidobacteriota bacterium]